MVRECWKKEQWWDGQEDERDKDRLKMGQRKSGLKLPRNLWRDVELIKK